MDNLATSQNKKYPPLSIEQFNKRFNAIAALWNEFLEIEGESSTEFFIHKPNMFEVIRRQDERKYYFEVFHDLDVPCEYKYVAIECFWINTLKPFMITDERSNLFMCPNEMFSLFLILSTIRCVFEKYKPKEKFKYPSNERMKDILYDFKYCTMSREAMIAYVETLADTYGVGISYLLDNRINRLDLPSRISDVWQ